MLINNELINLQTRYELKQFCQTMVSPCDIIEELKFKGHALLVRSWIFMNLFL